MKPFDLEAAKRGEPIVTLDGSPVKFIAHVPEANIYSRLVVMLNGGIESYCVDGSYRPSCKSTCDLFMAPRKRTVWINPYADGICDKYLYATEDDADNAQGDGRIGSRAWPLEIED